LDDDQWCGYYAKYKLIKEIDKKIAIAATTTAVLEAAKIIFDGINSNGMDSEVY
jgi:uncharacterized protein YjaZ